ncbi:MAG: dienelactone hydrolase family protein [Asticcacaulis sp.]
MPSSAPHDAAMDNAPLTRPEGSDAKDFHLSRRGIAGLFFAGYALGAGPAAAQAPITTPTSGLIAKDMTVPTGSDYRIPAYIAVPANAKRLPVVIVVPEIFGLHDYLRDVCRRLAYEGYVAITFDPFARAGNAAAIKDTAELRKLVETATNEQVMGDLKSIISWLKTNPDIGQERSTFGKTRFANTSRIGITGFCWGGAVVWMAASSIPDIRTGVAWYGRIERPKPEDFLGKEVREWPIDRAGDLRRPVLGLYAELDGGITLDSVTRMNAALKASGKTPSHIKVFKEAKHGFHADYRALYNEKAAREGWTDLLGWFKQYL